VSGADRLRKNAGGGLLREPKRIDSLLGALRDAVSVKLSVKTRLGFASPGELDTLLPIFAKHSLDLLTLHGRTVRDQYGVESRYDLIARASRSCPARARERRRRLRCQSPRGARLDGARGVMIGRGAIRNP